MMDERIYGTYILMLEDSASAITRRYKAYYQVSFEWEDKTDWWRTWRDRDTVIIKTYMVCFERGRW